LPVFIVAVALVAIGASSAASSARAVGGVQISVGYADSERANPITFPTPWVGDPGVIFEGCMPATSPTGKCIFDSSAVRLVNQGSRRVTVNKVVVTFPGAAAGGGACRFDIWPHNISLPAGQEVIFAQTSPRARPGCNPAGGYIDGSEMGPNGVDWGGGTHCTNSGIIPKVAATIDNSTQTFIDSGQVLNTTGQDTESCPKPIHGRRNESEPWTPPTCISPASLVLKRRTQTHFVGETATIKGTFGNGCGEPIQGMTETFHDLTGPDATLTGSRMSDANGQASVSYTSLVAGTDTWDATVTNRARTITSNTVSVIWIKPPCPTTTKANFRWLYRADWPVRSAGTDPACH
jgi:hypothetical protein